ncbi:helix-turn-helix domain-containing protein [Paenibacillus sp. HJL G12]|uniref:Helix-turn-helix domain-containing protein n=1 Tax=Paenibacillus dendrobii TaxID=2691084 RepID=A0A7X3LJ28_9BACL|nr:ArsR family transcriptional regulator [Paenibacillus dendrobii]MWV45815.1 helix-turn-helix domain-containing protein [Paenibacillus dendrobii]
MELDTTTASLPVYEALASRVRLNILQLLSERQMNVRELAEALCLSSAIMTMHVKKLEKARLITTRMAPGKGGVQKICALSAERIEITIPASPALHRKSHQTEVSVGHYTDFELTAPCGIATVEHTIGEYNEPRYFWYPERVQAKMLWFRSGYIEYKVPNCLLDSQTPEELEITCELSTMLPFHPNAKPSSLVFSFNRVELGGWAGLKYQSTHQGTYTPAWWSDPGSQNGMLKTLRINQDGTYVDGERISGVTLSSLPVRDKQWTFRIAVPGQEKNTSGITLFGKGFGNHQQDVLFHLYYSEERG